MLSSGGELTNTRMLRRINSLRCLGVLRNGPSLSRSEIARKLGMTRATVGNAIRPILAAGLVLELDDREDGSGNAGRPGIRLALNPRGAYFIGLDISTTAVNGVLLDFGMRVVARQSVPIAGDYRDVRYVLSLLADLPRKLLHGTKVLEKQVHGLCISIPGIVDKLGGVVSAPGLEWNDIDLRSRLRKRMKARWQIQVCNDTFAFASAVRAQAANGDMEDVLLVLLAEGIGGAQIRQGRIVDGSNGFAGEIGHMVMGTSIRPASANTFENLAGYQRFLPIIPKARSIAEGLLALSLIEKPDRRLKRALDDWANVLAIGFMNLIHILDPQRVVLGGPLAVLYPRVEERVKNLLSENLVHGFKVPPVTVAGVAADIAAIGAATVVRETLFTLPEITHSPQK